MANNTSSVELSRQYTSYSGCDIHIIVQGQRLMSAQAVSYAIQREKAPVYVLGSRDPLSFSRGKRGIAGTLVALLLDRHILFQDSFADLQFLANNDDIYPSLTNANAALAGGLDLGTVGGDNPLAPDFDETNIAGNYTVRPAWYVDQLPPFDIAVVAVNEYGKAAQMRIYGSEILNEGAGFSIDNMMLESQMTYVCRTILPWQPLGSWDMSRAGGGFTQETIAI